MSSSINSLIVNISEGASAAHAYIVEGVASEARSKFVQDMAKGLSCQAENSADRPCGHCPSCIQIDAGTNMDIYHMSKSGKMAYTVKDDAEPFIEKLNMSPYGRYRIGIIDEADFLSEVIQNKLLKTLEEPEKGSIIILAVSNRDNLLQTVRSRCSLIRMSEFNEADEAETSHTETIKELAKLLESKKEKFYVFRSEIEKNIKTREDALDMLVLVEEACRDKMIAGIKTGEMAMRIDLIEMAIADIHKQMDYKKALKRLFLEMEDVW